VRVLADPSPFNYSALMNRAVRAADTPLVALLNNDTEVLAADWLAELAGWLELPSVGAVGGKLYHGDGTIQHAGVVLGIGGVASHGHKGSPGDAPGYHGLLHCVRDTSAITAACMLTRRELFLEAGGFDEQLGVAYNDVDYCLRLRTRGKRIVFTPLAELHHFEGRSRGDDRRGHGRFDREIALMQGRWGAALRSDPFYNPNLSLQATDYRRRR
jgi:GT2 family glycosyltransferase